MCQQLKDLTFEQWLGYVFDHPVPVGDDKDMIDADTRYVL